MRRGTCEGLDPPLHVLFLCRFTLTMNGGLYHGTREMGGWYDFDGGNWNVCYPACPVSQFDCERLTFPLKGNSNIFLQCN